MKAEYISHYLSDRDVANFARQSFAKLADQYTETQNNKLIQFLARGMQSNDWENLIETMIDIPKPCAEDPLGLMGEQKARELAVYLRSIPQHWVPFGHPQITLRMQAPIPIRVQCFKHKIGFLESEESRRYISSTPEFFTPVTFRAAAENVKQGSIGRHERSAFWKDQYTLQCENAIGLYERMIADGVGAEQARLVLPQGCEVNWVWTGSLYAFSHAYNLRTDPHAQKEIQDLFDQIGKIIEPLYPVSWQALTQGKY